MKICVTGATGFVGTHLTNALCERGDEVVCLVRNVARARRILGSAEVELVLGSLRDRDAMAKACDGVDVIYHSAGLTTALNREGFFSVNADATAMLAEVAKEVVPQLTRFVFISSQAAAGPSRSGQTKTEADPAAPVSNYGASKLAGEDAARNSGLPWTIVRPCAVYGPGDSAFLTVFKLARFSILPMLGSPDQELSMIHVDDLVRSLLEVVVPETLGETYFACHPETVTGRSFISDIRRATLPANRKPPIVFGLPPAITKGLLAVTGTAASMVGKSTFLSTDKGNEMLAEAWVCSPEKLEQTIGWKAEIAVSDGVKSTASWYRENGWL